MSAASDNVRSAIREYFDAGHGRDTGYAVDKLQHKHESSYAEDMFVTCSFVSVCLAVLSFRFKGRTTLPISDDSCRPRVPTFSSLGNVVVISVLPLCF